MALQTADGTSDRIAVAANATIDDLTAFTTLQWVYMTAFTSGRRFWSKGPAAPNGKDLAMDFINTPNSVFFQVARATTTALASSVANIYADNAWACIVTTYDEADGPRIFAGSLTAALAEVSYAAARTIGAGATSADNTETLKIFNRQTLVGAPAGRVGEFLFWNRRLTLGELRTHQFRPHASSGLVVWHKYNEGTGTQRDYSGNKNTGTVTGATALANHVPLGVAFGGWEVQGFQAGANIGTAAVAVDGLAITAAGQQKSRGAASIIGDGIATSGAGRLHLPGAGSVALDDLAGSGVGVLRTRGSGIVVVDGIAASGAEAGNRVGVGTVSVDGISPAGQGTHRFIGTAAAAIDGIAMAGIGRGLIQAQGSINLDGLAVVGLGRLRINGGGSVAVDGIAANASAVVPTVYGRGRYSGAQAIRNRSTRGKGPLGFYDGGAA